MLVGAAVFVSLSFAPAHAQAANLVGTTTNQYGLGYSTDGYTCGANGLFWVFYNDGANWGYRSSANGIAWSAETTFTTAVPTPPGGTTDMAFTCSGSSVYYVGGQETIGDNVFYYNTGALNSNGVIVWSAETPVTTTGSADGYPSIALDTNNDVWVAIQTTPGGGITDIEVWEYVSSWTHSTTFSFASPSAPIPQLVTLAGGEMALTYGQPDGAGSSLSVATFSGSSWSPTVVSTSFSDYKFLDSDSVAIGSTVETCAADGTSVYYLSYTYGGASWTSPTTIAPGLACSLSSDGSSTLSVFYLSSATTIEYSQSDNSGGSFAASSVVSSGQSGVISIGAAFQISSNPAKQALAVWVSGTNSIEFSNISTAPVVNEQVTISSTNGGPVGTATISGCHATVASIPMDGSPHTFGADPSCSLTITVPPDTLYARYRFPGTASVWSYVTGASGTDTKTNSVYYQFAITASYSVTGAGTPPAPVMTSTETGNPLSPTLALTPTVYWLDDGAAWSVPSTITSGATTWATAPSSGTASGPTILVFAYAPPITSTTTSTTTATVTSTTTLTHTVTSTTASPTTVTSTVTSTSTAATATVTSTTTATTTTTTTATVSGGFAVPTASSMTCDQTRSQVNQRVNCTDVVWTADSGVAAGNVTWTTNGGGRFAEENCYLQNNNGQLQCQIQYTPTASGVQTLTATYSGDPYHSSSSDVAVIFVGNTGSSKLTALSLTCTQTYVKLGQSTICQATVSTADGGRAAGSVAWSSTDGGAFSRVNCQPSNGNGNGQLECSAVYTPGSGGSQVVTAVYSGDPSHLSSSGSFVVFVQNDPYANLAKQATVIVPGALMVTGLSVVILKARKGREGKSAAAES